MTGLNPDEVGRKVAAVAAVVRDHDLDRVVLGGRGSIGWLLDGAGTRGPLDRPAAALLACVDRDEHLSVVAPVAESGRLVDEELADIALGAEFGGAPMDLLFVPWSENPRDAALGSAEPRGLDSARIRFETDPAHLGAPWRRALTALRRAFTVAELERYEQLCADLTAAVDRVVASAVRVGTSEVQLAGELARAAWTLSLRPTGISVGSDGRSVRYRHPTPTTDTVSRRAILTLAAERDGMEAVVSRTVDVDEPSPELRARREIARELAEFAHERTRAGAAPSSMVRAVVDRFESIAGGAHAAEWQLDELGGPIGWHGDRTAIVPATAAAGADPADDEHDDALQVGQAWAWRLALPGVRLEDTLVVTTTGIDVLTASASAGSVPDAT